MVIRFFLYLVHQWLIIKFYFFYLQDHVHNAADFVSESRYLDLELDFD